MRAYLLIANICPFLPVDVWYIINSPIGVQMRLRKLLVGTVLGLAILASGHTILPWDDQKATSALRPNLLDSLVTRPTAGRLSGQSKYVPFRPDQPVSSESRASIRNVLRGFQGSDDPSDRALIKIIDKRFLAAIALLEEFAKRNPGDAKVLNDLSVAYLASARETDNPYFFFRALEASEEASNLDPSLDEVLFNRALILETLHLDFEAKQAWSRYLSKDYSSLWAGEASKRLEALPKLPAGGLWETKREALLGATKETISQIVVSFPQQTRLYAEEKLLGQWGSLYLAGRGNEARVMLSTAREIGIVLAAHSGDLLLKEAVGAIDLAASLPNGYSSLRRLAEGHEKFSDALTTYDKQETALASAKFETSRHLLEEGGTPFANWARFYEAVTDYFGFKFSRSLETLDSVRRVAEARQYRTLLARSYWMMGLNSVVQADPSPAVEYYQRAITIFSDTSERENAAAVYGLLGESLGYLGNQKEAWRWRFRALELKNDIFTYRRLHSLLAEFAEAATREGMPRVALRFQDSVVRAARKSGNSYTLSHALLRRGATLSRLGRAEESLHDFELARLVTEKILDPETNLRLRAETASAQGEALARVNASLALDHLNDALAIFNKEAYLLLARPLLIQRAALYSSIGDAGRAEADLRMATRASENYQKQLKDPATRADFFRQSAQLYDDLISLLVRRGDVGEAFEYAERARSATLLESILKTLDRSETELGMIPLSLTRASAMMPHGVVVLEYAVLDRAVVTWVIRHGSTHFLLLPATLDQIESTIARLAGSTGVDADERKHLAALHDFLVKPLNTYLAEGEIVIVVPDKLLSRIPFSALLDKTTGRFLIEEHELGYSPSCSVYLASRVRDRELSLRAKGPALIVGNPVLRADVFPTLAGTSVGLEVEDVAHIFRNSRLLTGKAATKERFLDWSRDATLIHFGVHAFVNKDNPLLSGLALASDGASSGALYASEIYHLTFPRTRQVVLAGCDTAIGTGKGGDDLAVLARAFLAGGIPSVVGSLRRVDDRAAAFIMENFYKRLASGKSVTAALRDAQVEALKSGDRVLSRPSSWNLFIGYGGGDS